MTWIHPLDTGVTQMPDVIGGKASGLILLKRLGLPVPPGFVISTEACRYFLRHNDFPDGLQAGIAAASSTARVSVRSGAQVSMPGMMDTILDLDPSQVHQAVADVFRSWETPRARTYRELNDIAHDLGTAVIVQEMVYGDRDEHSGTGVVFSRDPNTGEPRPFGEVLFGHRGEDVVSGTKQTLPLSDLENREPAIWGNLREGLQRIEKHYRDACYVEFTFEAGKLWFLQVRQARLVGRAAVRVAVDLADEGAIDRREAVNRVSEKDLKRAGTPRMEAETIHARGLGACPGVATGRVATTSDKAVAMAAEGPVILVRPLTSPLDMHGLAAAAGVVTATGGPASHAAVVARAMGKPAVVGVQGMNVPDGTMITIDGTSGQIALGSARTVTGDSDPHLHRLREWAEGIGPVAF